MKKKRRHYELKVYDDATFKFVIKEQALAVKKALKDAGINVKVKKIKKVI